MPNVIVNPNLIGSGFGMFRTGRRRCRLLCDGGLKRRLDEAGAVAGRRAWRCPSSLDLVALGTVADVVPPDFHNRCWWRKVVSSHPAGAALPASARS